MAWYRVPRSFVPDCNGTAEGSGGNRIRVVLHFLSWRSML